MAVQTQILIPVGRLQLVFHWRGDRYGHRLELAAGATRSTEPTQVFLESAEGTPDDAWPASPPLQECHVEPRPDGRSVALLVGRAGKSHWSLSVLCDPGSSSLIFEVACRLTGEPQWLGSRYQAAGAIAVEPQSHALSDILPAAAEGFPELLLEAAATDQRWRLLLPRSLDMQATSRPDEIAIAALDRPSAAVRTVQWSYQVRPARP